MIIVAQARVLDPLIAYRKKFGKWPVRSDITAGWSCLTRERIDFLNFGHFPRAAEIDRLFGSWEQMFKAAEEYTALLNPAPVQPPELRPNDPVIYRLSSVVDLYTPALITQVIERSDGVDVKRSYLVAYNKVVSASSIERLTDVITVSVEVSADLVFTLEAFTAMMQAKWNQTTNPT